MQETISVKIPKELKKKMKKLPIKWSEVIRKSIEEEILAHDRREAIEDLMELASKAPKVSKGTSVRILRIIRKAEAGSRIH